MTAPDGYTTISAYVVVEDPDATASFLAHTFGATVHTRMARHDGSAAHLEVRIGDSVFMMGATRPGVQVMRSHMYVYVDDVDATLARALQRGAQPMYPATDMWYGDRSAGIVDPDGNAWFISRRIEDLDPDELQRRALANDPTAPSSAS